jgi:hypothetical protein
MAYETKKIKDTSRGTSNIHPLRFSALRPELLIISAHLQVAFTMEHTKLKAVARGVTKRGKVTRFLFGEKNDRDTVSVLVKTSIYSNTSK